MTGAPSPGTMVDGAATGTPLETPGGGGVARSSDRIRLLQFLPVFAIGGTERQVVNLARGLDPSRFELHFGCLHKWGELLDEVAEREIPVAEYRINKLYNAPALRERLRFARDLKRERINIVHAYNFYGNVFAIPAARLAGVPVLVASMRGLDADLTPLRRRAPGPLLRPAPPVRSHADAVARKLRTAG